MTDEQPPLDPSAAGPGDVPPPPPVTPPVEGGGWVQPAPGPAAPAPVEGAGWVQPAPGPSWGAPAAPVQGSGWVQPTQPPAAAPGPAWGQPPAGPPAAAPGPAWGQPPAAPPAPPAPPAAPAGWAQPQAPAPVQGGTWAQPNSGWVQPATVKGPVTILARIAGLFLVLLGLLWGALGGLVIAGGTAFHFLTDRITNLNSDPNVVANAGNAVSGFIIGVGIFILVLAVIEVLAGLGAMLGKGFGRVIGILYSLVFGSFLLIGIATGSRAAADSTVDTSGAGAAFLFFLVMFVMYLYAAVVLILRWRGPARA